MDEVQSMVLSRSQAASRWILRPAVCRERSDMSASKIIKLTKVREGETISKKKIEKTLERKVGGQIYIKIYQGVNNTLANSLKV